MSDIDATMAWNRGIPYKIFKSLIKLYFSYFLFYGFNFYINFFMNGKVFIYVI